MFSAPPPWVAATLSSTYDQKTIMLSEQTRRPQKSRIARGLCGVNANDERSHVIHAIASGM
jgi:hypothetical protein